jgi:hypothetical protein
MSSPFFVPSNLKTFLQEKAVEATKQKRRTEGKKFHNKQNPK